MKIRFNGIREEKKTGCRTCGGRRVYTSFKRIKTFSTPSGRTVTFRYGEVLEVSRQEGEFLLQQQHGVYHESPVFTVLEDEY